MSIFRNLSSYDELITKTNDILDSIKAGNNKVSGDSSGLPQKHRVVMEQINEIIFRLCEHEDFEITKLNLVMEASNIGLWDMRIVKGDPVNPNNTFIWSDKFRRMVGYSDESDFPNLLSSWSDKLHPEDKERTLNSFSSHLLDRTGRTPYDLEYRLLKKNGEYSYYHAFGATIRDEEGYALRVAGALEDITQRKMQRDQLENHINEFTREINGMTQLMGEIISITANIAKMQKTNLNLSEDSLQHTEETQSIITSIKDISSQTQILGINAAIESAHAGETGKSFAVVANEVRSLAINSQDSSEQIEEKLMYIQNTAKEMASSIKVTDELVVKQNQIMNKLKDDLNNVNQIYAELVEMIKQNN
jgi:PAS domain S-box-containing protein